ncbi:unnamed protein product [Rotaria sp. Silwood2]|nr:unnamed protein product [Rotaria sp. Silwood2]CAF4241423.1 unnamed protein product [Rotaria sp. Silwood2]
MPKPSRSAFYFYALEYQRRFQQNNGQRLSINDAIAACYDEWKLLSDEEKQPYKILYEEWRIQYRLDPDSAINSNQRSLQTKKALKQEIKNEKILSERDIPCEELKIHYDRFSFERDYLAFEYLPLDINELLTMPIYIINFQIFCKVDEEDGGQFIPAEMCILRYTLAEGATILRQVFIKPDKIPPGYMSACLEHLKSTHEIPLKDFAEASDDYKTIYQQLKSFLIPNIINKTNQLSDDDRTRRRYQRLSQPCVFFPAVEYEQTSRLMDWLQEKAEGIKPTKDTRLVNFASIESLIMLLVELKKQRVSRDDIHKTFENAAYSFMIEERCNYHSQLGISYCSVARCYASAKLMSAYLNQLYVPERPASIMMTGKRPLSTSMMNSETSSITSMNNLSNRLQQPSILRPSITSQIISSQYSTTGTSDSIASSYHSPEQKAQQQQQSQLKSPIFPQSSSSTKYSYESQQPQSNQQDLHVSDELVHHPTIIKLQQQNFHRLLSSAASTTSSSSIIKQQQQTSQIHLAGNNDRATCFSTTTITTNDQIQPIKQSSDTQRAVLHQRKQALMKAIQKMALLFRSTLIQSLTKTTRPMLMIMTSNARRNMSSHNKETDEEFDQRWKAYFERPNIDGWDIRQGINHMNRLDLIPEPEIISACLQACRRVNDHSLAVRYLEAIRYKSNAVSNQVWPWVLQEIRPTLNQLGISTPEELGYDKPELALKSVDDM